MAMFSNTELFKCTQCQGKEFKVETIKSFVIGQATPDGTTLLWQNTGRKKLVCSTCNKQHDMSDYMLVESQE